MKKIIIGTLLGLVISILIFLPFWRQAAQIYIKMNEGQEKHCRQQKICDECKFNFACLNNKCNSDLSEQCRYIEENFSNLSRFGSDVTKEDFYIKSLCGDRTRSSAICEVKIKNSAAYFKANTFRIALGYISMSIGVGYLLGNFSPIFAFIILLMPIFLGFFIGFFLKIRGQKTL